MRWDWDYVTHALVGAAITVPWTFFASTWDVPFLFVACMTPVAFWREFRQIQPDREKTLSGHKVAEALAFTAGGLVIATVGIFV